MKLRFSFFIAVLVMFVLGIFMTTSSAFAQSPTYLHVNSEKDGALEVSKVAAALKYDGVIVGITETSNPSKHDWSGFTSTVQAAAKAGLRIHLRMNPAADREALPSGWNQPYRLPLANTRSAALYLAHGIDIIAAAYAGHLDRCDTAELGNEAGIGGADGAYIGRWSKLRPIYQQFNAAYKNWLAHRTSANEATARKYWDQVFPDAMWPRGGFAPPEGTIESAYFDMVLAELQVLGPRYPWLKIYGPTLEGATGTVGQTELNSWKCRSGDTILGLTNGRIGTNRYMGHKVTSADQAAKDFQTNLNSQLQRIRANPLMKRVFVTEMGIPNTGLVPEIAAARQATLMIMRTMAIDGGGQFRCTDTDALTTGQGIVYPVTFAPIGKFVVGPGH